MKDILNTQNDGDDRIDIITSGDIAQLPPLFETFVFSPPAAVKQEFIHSENLERNEYKLKSVLIILLSLLASTYSIFEYSCQIDQTYETLLGSRLWKHSNKDFEIPNSRFLNLINPESEVAKQFLKKGEKREYVPIDVQANTSRHSINWLSSSEISRSSSEVEITIVSPAVFSATKRGTKPTVDQLYEFCIDILFTVMSIYITQNISPKIPLAKRDEH